MKFAGSMGDSIYRGDSPARNLGSKPTSPEHSEEGEREREREKKNNFNERMEIFLSFFLKF